MLDKQRLKELIDLITNTLPHLFGLWHHAGVFSFKGLVGPALP
jgi:hypothetical protein